MIVWKPNDGVKLGAGTEAETVEMVAQIATASGCAMLCIKNLFICIQSKADAPEQYRCIRSGKTKAMRNIEEATAVNADNFTYRGERNI